MQKSNSQTPKVQRVKRSHLEKPESDKHGLDSTTIGVHQRSYRRATMGPSSSALENLPVRRRIAMHNNTSIMALQEPPEGPKSSDVESDDVELSRLYDEYLQGHMSMLVVKKKALERNNLLLTQLATISKEIDLDQEKLFTIRKRERDLINLTKVQNEMDAQVVKANELTSGKLKALRDTLSQLSVLLKPSDVLRCTNIIVPESTEEWTETEQALKQCAATLKSIVEQIGDKSEAYKNVHSGIKDFVKMCNEVRDVQQSISKTLCDLQVMVLKAASFALTPSDEVLDG